MFLNKYQYLLFSVITIVSVGCNQNSVSKLTDVEIYNLSNQVVRISFNNNETIKTFFFLSPECPFCINYTKTISEIVHNKKYSDVIFYAVYPGTFYSNDEIREFHSEYNFNIEVLVDPELELTHLLKATVTPQAIIINNSGELVYSGAIDNWAVDTGVKRQVISENYLTDALESVISGNIPSNTKTKPVGCFIEL